MRRLAGSLLLLAGLVVSADAGAASGRTAKGTIICAEEKNLLMAIELWKQRRLSPKTMPPECGGVREGLQAIELGGDENMRKLRIWMNAQNSIVVWAWIPPDMLPKNLQDRKSEMPK